MPTAPDPAAAAVPAPAAAGAAARPQAAAAGVGGGLEAGAAHATAIWRYLRMLGAGAEEADELRQETLLAGLRTGLPDDVAAARAFLRGIARNQWLRTRRWWQRRREREVAAAVEELWLAHAAHDDGEERIARLRECLGALQPRVRNALELHYRDGLAWPEVARLIGLRPNGTKTLVQRARHALRLCLGGRS